MYNLQARTIYVFKREKERERKKTHTREKREQKNLINKIKNCLHCSAGKKLY